MNIFKQYNRETIVFFIIFIHLAYFLNVKSIEMHLIIIIIMNQFRCIFSVHGDRIAVI